MQTIYLTIKRLRNGWLIQNDDNIEESYIAATTFGFDGVGGIVRNICEREEREWQQTDNTKTL